MRAGLPAVLPKQAAAEAWNQRLTALAPQRTAGTARRPADMPTPAVDRAGDEPNGMSHPHIGMSERQVAWLMEETGMQIILVCMPPTGVACGGGLRHQAVLDRCRATSGDRWAVLRPGR
jgi:hypothetical protein